MLKEPFLVIRERNDSTTKARKLRSSNISLPVDKTSVLGPLYYIRLSYL